MSDISPSDDHLADICPLEERFAADVVEIDVNPIGCLDGLVVRLENRVQFLASAVGTIDLIAV